MKITNIAIVSLNAEGNHFALCCEYKGCRYHIWCNDKFELDATGGMSDVLYKNPPNGVEFRKPGYFSTRYLSATSMASIEIIATMVNYARRNGLLEGARAAQADDKAAEQVKQDAAMLERRKEKLGPEMFARRMGGKL
jgi:hypothetical protein